MWGRKSKIQEETAVLVTPEVIETPEVMVKKSGPSSIAADATVYGAISSTGDLSVEGRVEGDVRCALFTVGAAGHVAGNVTAETATIRGRVSGNVIARTILLAGTGSIEGDLTHAVLIIEEGGVFEGRSKRQADPLADQTQAIAAPVQKAGDETNTIIDKAKPKSSTPRRAKAAKAKPEVSVTPSSLADELNPDFALNLQ